MSGQALYITLRVPDPAALTALAALRAMAGRAGATAPASLGLTALERGRIWHLEGNGDAFDNAGGAWFNQNKEAAGRWSAAAPPWASGAGQEWWVLVRERGSTPEAAALRSLREQGRAVPGDLVSALVWRLWMQGGAQEGRAAAEAAAVVRTNRQGLLVNPHSQAFRLCRPPASLEELRSVLRELREEAA